MNQLCMDDLISVNTDIWVHVLNAAQLQHHYVSFVYHKGVRM